MFCDAMCYNSTNQKARAPLYLINAIFVFQGQEYAALGALVSDDEPLSTPPGATEMELKVKQVIRLLENLECTMIYDVIRRISREHTLVVSERGRDDATLPTDLWKKPVSVLPFYLLCSVDLLFGFKSWPNKYWSCT